MQIRWKASFSASCLHAAACLYEGLPISDSTTATVLQPAVDQLLRELTANGLQPESTLPLLVNYAGELDNNRQLVDMTVKRAKGADALSDATLGRLAGCIADLEAAWLQHQPRLVEELAVRGRPLREQWEARGPGLLRAVERLTAENLIAPSAEVVLVSPIVGGHGRAHLRSNRVTLEAVLTNPYPELPETLRLGWLLAQLNLDLPMLSETVSSIRLPQLARLATLPLILAAAESVEFIESVEETIVRALDCWYVVPNQTDELAKQLHDWWQAYVNSNTRWPVALAALDAMISE